MSLLSETLDLIKKNNLYLHRRYGQNFLVDENVLKKIIKASEFSKRDFVVEIGTGFGFVTSEIAPHVKKIITFEIDRGIFNVAKEVLKNSQNVILINQDFLKMEFSELPLFRKEKVIIFGNLPYSIASLVIEKIIKNFKKIKSAYLLVQKELAERILSFPGNKNYSSFSIFCQYHAKSQKLFSISRNCFFPKPEVDSVFLKMEPLKIPPVKLVDEKLFFNIIRNTFKKRRKTLYNALSKSEDLKIPKIKLDSAFNFLKINHLTRGENLSLTEFAQLANFLAK